MLFIYEMLRAMHGDDPQTPSPHFSCRYVKANGQVAEIADARIIRFEKTTHTVIVRTPGGARSLKLFAIVEYNGEEVFL